MPCRAVVCCHSMAHFVPRSRSGLVVMLALSSVSVSGAADPPCDRYPAAKQSRCQAIWRQLNDEAVREVAQFGLTQQKRRDAGQLTPEQHLAENFAYIKQSTDKRLKELDNRMAKE